MADRKNHPTAEGRDTLTTTERNLPNAGGGRRRAGHLLPPGMQPRILKGTPSRLRSDVLQEAWLAYLEGRSASTAARNYLRRQLREEANCTAASQLPLDMRREYQQKCY